MAEVEDDFDDGEIEAVSELTSRKLLFVLEYLVDLNGAAAARRAGYEPSAAKRQATRLLCEPLVQEAIRLAMARRIERTEVTQDQVLRELAKVAFANLSDVTDWGVKEIAFGFTEDGKRLPAEQIGDAAVVRYVDAPYVNPVNRDELAPDVRAAVAEVKLGREGFSIKMHDKVAALEKLARHLGMFKDKVELTGKDGAELAGPVVVYQLPDNGR